MWMAQFLRVYCDIDSTVGSFGRRVVYGCSGRYTLSDGIERWHLLLKWSHCRNMIRGTDATGTLQLCWYVTCMLRLARPRHRILRRSTCSTVCDRRRSCEFVDFRNSMRVLGRIASKDRVPVSQPTCRLEFLCTQYYHRWTEILSSVD